MATTIKRIYLAGPLGFSELGRLGLEAVAALGRTLGHAVVDPFALTPPEQITRIARLPSLDAQRDAWRDLNQRIGAANMRAIDSCDLVLAILDGPDVDSGTAAEIGYAFARGKLVLGYRGDFRLAADNVGSTVNLQVEYFILASGGEILASLDALRARLAEF
ncbi:MAG: nucleoside 2-deoxyribosyltransferase [Rhodoblastus sp.]